MVNIPAILIANSIGLVLLIVVLVSSAKGVKFKTADKTYFYLMVFSIMLLLVLETISFLIDGTRFPGAQILNRLVNVMIFAFDSFPIMFWLFYVDYKIFESEEKLKKYAVAYITPSVTIFLISIINLFTDVFFSIDADNHYHREAPAGIIFLVSMICFIHSFALVFKNKKNIRNYLFMPVVFFLISPIIGCILQFIFYGISLIWVSVAISIVVLYINIQHESTSTDFLTGLFNRQRLDKYMSDECSKTSGKTMLCGIMLDIDKFKSINDTFGHSVGDNALVSMSDILMKALPKTDFIARYAGDEFIILSHITNEKEALDKIARIHREIEAFNKIPGNLYSLSASAGYAIYKGSQNDSTDRFMCRMDASMYNNKKEKVSESIR